MMDKHKAAAEITFPKEPVEQEIFVRNDGETWTEFAKRRLDEQAGK